MIGAIVGMALWLTGYFIVRVIKDMFKEENRPNQSAQSPIPRMMATSLDATQGAVTSQLGDHTSPLLGSYNGAVTYLINDGSWEEE